IPLASTPVSLIRSTSVGLDVEATIASAGVSPNPTYIPISWCSANPYEYFAETPASLPSTIRAPAAMYFGKLYARFASRWANCGVAGAEQGGEGSHVL